MTLELYWLENCPYFDSRFVIYARKMFIRLATGLPPICPLLLKKGQSRPLFVYFCFFLITISIQIEKSIDGMLGIRTRGCRMVGTKETTELWRPPYCLLTLLNWIIHFFGKKSSRAFNNLPVNFIFAIRTSRFREIVVPPNRCLLVRFV